MLEDGRPKDGIDSTEVIANLGADSTSLDSSDSKQDSKEKDKRGSSKHSRRDKDRGRKSSKDKSDRLVAKLLHNASLSVKFVRTAKTIKKRVAAKITTGGKGPEAKNTVQNTVTEKGRGVETGINS